MKETKYNGWTNYATWRVNLEIFDGFEPDKYYSAFDPTNVANLAGSLQEYAEEVIFDCAEVPNGLARDYAMAFLSDVNWYEIADHMITNYLEDILTKGGF